MKQSSFLFIFYGTVYWNFGQIKRKRFEYVNILNIISDASDFIGSYDIVRIYNSHSSQAKSKCISIAHLKAPRQNTVYKKHKMKHGSYKN